MRWSATRLKTNFLALVQAGDRASEAEEARFEALRKYILDELGEYGEQHHPQITRRVRYARDAQGLWYARGEMMTVLSAHHGEAEASARLTLITRRFRGLLPRSLSSRPSPLTPN